MEERIFQICDALLVAITPVIERINEQGIMNGEWAEVCATMACSILVNDEEDAQTKKLKYGKMLHHIAEWIGEDLPEVAARADRNIAEKAAEAIIQGLRESLKKEGV